MKKCSILLLLFVWGSSGYGQGVGIGTSAPSGSAALQVSSGSQGMLMPRLTAAERMGIVHPAGGLLVYQTDGTPGFYCFNGAAWTSVTGSALDGRGVTETYGWISTVFGDGPNNTGVGAQVGTGINQGLSCDRSGNFYVVNVYGEICKVNVCGTLTVLAGKINDPNRAYIVDTDGVGSAATIADPTCVATDLAGNVYFTESFNNTIRKISPAGVVTTVAGRDRVTGYVDGPAAMAEFDEPVGLTVDPAGNIYVADTQNGRIRKIGTDGMVSTLAGNGQGQVVDGVGTAASFKIISDVQSDVSGNLFVVDYNAIRKITPAGVVTTVAAINTFPIPRFLTIDKDGNIYFDDAYQAIYKFSSSGVITTLYNTPDATHDQDGPRSQGLISLPRQLTIGPGGNLYVLTGFGLKKILLH
jgi:NHL repeat-containing protein